MDNLPAMKRGLIVGKTEKVTPIKKMVGQYAPTYYSTGYYSLFHVVLVAIMFLVFGVIGTLYWPLAAEQVQQLMVKHDLEELKSNWLSLVEEVMSKR
jgi:hypothetical protein